MKKKEEIKMKQKPKKYFWHPMTDTRASEQETIIIERGEGNYIFNDCGEKLLDAVGGLWCMNVGHNRKTVNDAISEQMNKLSYYQLFTNIAHPKAYELAEKIITLAENEDMAKVFFTSGGSDSVDTALKITRQYWEAVEKPKKKMFISLERAYHGMHYGGTSVGGNDLYRKFIGPTLEGCIQVSSPHKKNKWNCEDPEKLTQLCIEEIIEKIDYYGADNIAAFIMEPIQGAGGIIVPPASYWPAVREVCDQYDILLISDEVVTGFGRSGSMFGCRGWGVKPDVMVLAKGLSSGYIPMGATVFNQRIVNGIESAENGANIIIHGQTYSGHPLGCVAALEVLKIVENENLPQNAKEVGAYLLDLLKPIQSEYSEYITDVRGKGLMLAIDFEDAGNFSPEEITNNVQHVADYAISQGVLVRDELKTIIISPSLTFTKEEAKKVYSSLANGLESLRRKNSK